MAGRAIQTGSVGTEESKLSPISVPNLEKGHVFTSGLFHQRTRCASTPSRIYSVATSPTGRACSVLEDGGGLFNEPRHNVQPLSPQGYTLAMKSGFTTHQG